MIASPALGITGRRGAPRSRAFATMVVLYFSRPTRRTS